MSRAKIFAALLITGVLLAMASSWSNRPGKVLYVGGPVLTMDTANSVVEALATDGPRIVAIG